MLWLGQLVGANLKVTYESLRLGWGHTKLAVASVAKSGADLVNFFNYKYNKILLLYKGPAEHN